MATKVWSVFSDGKDEYDFLHATAEFLGRYDDEIIGLSAELFEQSWDTFTTLTRAEYDPEYYPDIDPSTLPATPRFFDADVGIDRFTRLRAAIVTAADSDEGDDFSGDTEYVLEDLEGILKTLQEAKRTGRRWFLAFDVG